MVDIDHASGNGNALMPRGHPPFSARPEKEAKGAEATVAMVACVRHCGREGGRACFLLLHFLYMSKENEVASAKHCTKSTFPRPCSIRLCCGLSRTWMRFFMIAIS